MQDQRGVESFTGKYRFLSNFWPAKVIGPGGYTYSTVEHAYQASKTEDDNEWVVFASDGLLMKPGDAKRRGSRLKVIRKDWDTIKLPTMSGLLRQKFAPGSDLAAKLMAIDGDIVEGNYWGDTFWGVSGGHGFNHLGRMLMDIRAELKRVS